MFNNSRKAAQQTAQRLISGHFALITWWALKHAGVLEAILKLDETGEGLDPLVHATRANMSPDVLGALIDYLAAGGLLVRKDQQARLSAEGRALLDHEDALLELMRSYEPVLDAVEHLLARLKTPGGGGGTGGIHRKTERLAEAQASRYAAEVFPAIEAIITQHQMEHLLDLNCGAADLLIYLAARQRNIVGVGIGADGTLVRRGNLAITAANLEKRLIQVPANPVDACTDTKRVFDRIGITPQLWSELDGIIATNLFAEPGARDADHSPASVIKTLTAMGRNFPKARLILIEPTFSARFEKNYYAPELTLVLRLCNASPWPPEQWRDVIEKSKLRLIEEVSLATDGLTVFCCAPGKAVA